MMKDTSTKKKARSPNETLLRSFYSKQKSKSEYSPVGRSITKEQIKQQIKKVVYNSNRSQDRQLQANQHSLPREEDSNSNLRASLTPKNSSFPKKQSDR